MISSSQKPLLDNTQHSQETDMHVPDGIRTRNPSKGAEVDPHPRSRGPWDRRDYFVRNFILLIKE